MGNKNNYGNDSKTQKSLENVVNVCLIILLNTVTYIVIHLEKNT